MDKTGPEALPV